MSEGRRELKDENETKATGKKGFIGGETVPMAWAGFWAHSAVAGGRRPGAVLAHFVQRQCDILYVWVASLGQSLPCPVLLWAVSPASLGAEVWHGS